jgi:hypothetical protein
MEAYETCQRREPNNHHVRFAVWRLNRDVRLFSPLLKRRCLDDLYAGLNLQGGYYVYPNDSRSSRHFDRAASTSAGRLPCQRPLLRARNAR